MNCLLLTGILALTVALRLIAIVLMRTASELCAKTKNTQNIAVAKVLPASDHRRPSVESTRYAPSYRYHCQLLQDNDGDSVKILTIAPGQPPIEYMTTSHKLSSRLLGAELSEFPLPSKSLGRYTLNIVNADTIHQHVVIIVNKPLTKRHCAPNDPHQDRRPHPLW